MEDRKGWIKLWRKSIESQVFQDSDLWKVWSWCLMKSNHDETWVSVQTGKGYTQVKLMPGQFIFGRFQASKELKMKASTLRNRVLKLKNIGNLDIQPDTHFSIISIVNWDIYQSINNKLGQATGQPEDTQRTGTGQPEDTNNNIKNNKNVKNKESISHSDVKIFLSFYVEKFKENFNEEPIIEWGKDGKIVKNLLRVIQIDSLKELLEKFFNSEDSFIQKSGYTMGVFKSQINKLKVGEQNKKHAGLRQWAQEIMEEENERNRSKSIFDSNSDAI